MDYEWDEEKRHQNLRKHGVDFLLAYDFEWDCALAWEDSRKQYGEARWVATSFIDDRLYVMVWTWRKDKRRIISLRKANMREVKRYAES